MKNIIDKAIIIFLILLVIAALAFSIWVYATYGGKPVNEVPSWVHWFMINK